MKKIFLILFAVLLFNIMNTKAQAVITNKTTETASNSAILKLSSTDNRGLLLPNVTTSQRKQLKTVGLIVYNTTTKSVEFLTGTGWKTLTSTGAIAITDTQSTSPTGIPALKFGTGADNVDAHLQLEATDKALQLPEVSALPAITDGLVCIRDNKFCFCANGAWSQSIK